MKSITRHHRLYCCAALLLLAWATSAQSQTWESLLATGDSLIVKGQFTEAKSLLEQALTQVESALGAEDPSVATVLLALGKSYYYLADYSSAE